MGKYQFPVSIDESYKPACKEIMEADRTYYNKRTKEPNYKKICEDAIRLLNLFKTGKIKGVALGFYCDKLPTDADSELIRRVLSEHGKKHISDNKASKSD